MSNEEVKKNETSDLVVIHHGRLVSSNYRVNKHTRVDSVPCFRILDMNSIGSNGVICVHTSGGEKFFTTEPIESLTDRINEARRRSR